jgi:hypothetical protein
MRPAITLTAGSQLVAVSRRVESRMGCCIGCCARATADDAIRTETSAKRVVADRVVLDMIPLRGVN